jgi:hypothetical protein
MTVRSWILAGVCLLGAATAAQAQDAACHNFSQQKTQERIDECTTESHADSPVIYKQKWHLHLWVVCNEQCDTQRGRMQGRDML